MIIRRLAPITRRAPWLALALGLALARPAAGLAQEPPKDDALDRLLEQIDEKAPAPKGEPKSDDGAKAKPAAGDKAADAPKKDDAAAPKPAAEGAKPGAGEVSSKDEAIDSLLEKIGGEPDRPDAPGKPGAPGPGGDPAGEPPAQPGESPKPGEGAKKPGEELKGGDQAIDEDLERQMGRVRKKKGNRDEDAGMLADSVKQMREVERRLSQPDTGEETRQKQKQILKQLDQVLVQVRIVQSKSQGKQPGQGKPGDPQPGNGPNGNEPGASPHDVTAVTKPKNPKQLDRNKTNKDAWGQLPPDLQVDKANAFGERPLPGKATLVDRYFEAVAKKAAAGSK